MTCLINGNEYDDLWVELTKCFKDVEMSAEGQRTDEVKGVETEKKEYRDF